MASPDSIYAFLDAVLLRQLITTNKPNDPPFTPDSLPKVESTILNTLSTWASTCKSPSDARSFGRRIGNVLSAAAPKRGIESYDLETMLRDVVEQGKEKQKELEIKPGDYELVGMKNYFALDDLLIFTEAMAEAVKKVDWRRRMEEWVMGVVEKRG